MASNIMQVSIQMPSPKHIKNIVDRMKNISHSLVVSANKHGRLILKLKTNMVTLSAHFPDLNVESFAVAPTILSNDDTDNDNEEADQVSATVDVKKFLMCLYGMQLNNCKTVCSIIQGNMVKLHLEQPGSLSLQYFLTQIVI